MTSGFFRLTRVRFRRILYYALLAAVVAALLLGTNTGLLLHASADMRDRDIVRRQAAAADSGRSTTTSAVVVAEGAVDHGTLLREAEAALSGAVAGASVKVRGADAIPFETLDALAGMARRYKRNFELRADTPTAGGKGVQGRMYVPVNPYSLQGTGQIALGVYTDEAATDATKRYLQQHFRNEMAVVSLSHRGGFGGRVQVAVKPDFGQLNTERLVFYRYDSSENNCVTLADHDYYLDGNGYVHFFVDTGGIILITDRPLTFR